MSDTKTLRNIDTELVRYMNRLIEDSYSRFIRSRIVLIGWMHDGSIMPNFYMSDKRVLKDQERIARVFNGDVLLYFIREKELKQRHSGSVGDYISGRLLEKTIKDSLEENKGSS